MSMSSRSSVACPAITQSQPMLTSTNDKTTLAIGSLRCNRSSSSVCDWHSFMVGVLNTSANKKQCRDTVSARSPPPHHLVWGTKLGEHDPQFRMEKMTPPLETYTSQPAVSNHKSVTPLRDIAQNDQDEACAGISHFTKKASNAYRTQHLEAVQP